LIRPARVASQEVQISSKYDTIGVRFQARVRGCSSDTTLTGVLKGRGIGMVVVDTGGRPLLETMRLLEVDDVSMRAGLSFAARALSDCRFEAAKTSAGPVAAWAGFKFSTSRTGRPLISREQLPSALPGAPLLTGTRPVDTGKVYAQADSLLEELPRQIRCYDGTGRGGFTQTPRRTAEEVLGSIRSGDGRAEVSYIVRADGSVDPSSLAIVTTDNWSLAEAFLGRMADCQFAPGRIQGQAVAVKIFTRISRYARSIM